MNQGLGYEIAGVMKAALATGLFVSSCTFVELSQIQGSTGNSIGGYVLVAGLPQNIPAMNAPLSVGRLSSDQTQRFDRIESARQRHMLLGAYYPTLDTGFNEGAGKGWQVRVTDPDGVTQLYNFQGGEGDSQQVMTRIRCQLVTV